jgi:hypothetical protein
MVDTKAETAMGNTQRREKEGNELELEIEWHGGGATPAVGNEWSTMRGRSVAGVVALIKKGKHVALARQNKKKAGTWH